MAFLARASAAVLMLRLSLCLSGGEPAPPTAGGARVERRLASMGTMLAVSVAGPDRVAALAASETAVREIGRVEKRITTWRPGGPLDRLNGAKPGEAVALDPEVSGLLAAVFDCVSVRKGPSTRQCSRSAGVGDALLDLGGQVSAIGRAAVAVADPRERSHAGLTLVIADKSVSTSGNSERGRVVEGRRIGHLLDPRTGHPAIEEWKLGEAAPAASDNKDVRYGVGPAASKVYGKKGVSIGGYGEFLYQNFGGRRQDGEPSGLSSQVDLLRAVLYFGYKFDDRWVLNTEIEVEHAVTGSDKGGEVAVEFAYLA